MTDTRVGVVVGRSPIANQNVSHSGEPIASAIDSAGGKPIVAERVGQLDDSPAFIVAVGESALRTLIPTSPAPILPIDTNTPGLDPISRDRAETVLSTLLDLHTTHDTDISRLAVTHPVIGVKGDQQADWGHALMDVTLLTTEPARISEYTVAAGSDTEILSVRADGVVVATPAGSHGYAHAAGGPHLAPETGVGAVVPVAPFATDTNHWVVSLSQLRLTVDRDEASVELLLDGRPAGTVLPTETLCLQPVGAVETIAVQQGLEKL